MSFKDLKALAEALAPVIRAHTEAAGERLAAEFEARLSAALEEQNKAFLEIVQKEPEIPEEVIKSIAERAASLIEPPSDGKDGESVTLDDVHHLIVEEVTKQVMSREWPSDGRDGLDGKSVEPEDLLPLIREEVAAVITNIELPQDGKDGKSALDLDILPRIDLEKSYPRNTYATHDGGLWRSHQTTSGMRGWECIVDGVASFDVEQGDARNYRVLLRSSSGKTVERDMVFPTWIYRGVFKQGEYQQGDVVTFGGSLWHCNEPTDERPGENKAAWTLCAKKGRDGK